MAAHVDTGSVRSAPRGPRNDVAVVAGAVALAIVAALAAQMGAPKAQPLVGAVVILGIAYAFSTDRRAIDPRTVAWGLGLQIVFAWLVLTRPTGQRVFQVLGAAINRLLGFAGVGWLGESPFHTQHRAAIHGVQGLVHGASFRSEAHIPAGQVGARRARGNSPGRCIKLRCCV